jgi:WD40 repeat protein
MLKTKNGEVSYFKFRKIKDKLLIFRNGIITLSKELEQIKIENRRLLSEIEQLKVTAKQNKDINLIQSETKKILSLLEHHYRQEEQQNKKDYIQDIKSKISDSQEEMKQYIHSHIEQIQKKEEETFTSLKTTILPEIQTIKRSLNKDNDINPMKQEFNKLENLLLTIQSNLSKLILDQPLKELEDHITINNIHSNSICSIIELQDKRIALCSKDKSISVYTIDYKYKKWTQDIKQVNAHEDNIYDLCEINNNTLVSVSKDKIIKIWKISQNNLLLFYTLTKHTDKIFKVITLNNELFATSSRDKTIKIWKNITPFNEVKTLIHNGSVSNMIKLKTKEIILSSNWDTQSIDRWDLNNYIQITSIKGIYTHGDTHEMIELPNMFIAVSSVSEGNPIVIIEYCIVKVIKDPEYMTDISALCVLNCYSFIYVRDGIKF